MKGYIYKLYKDADPATGWIFNDPIFGDPPTLGACVPNVRRNVEIGDWVFCVSGRVQNFQPYIVGGFQIAEKITALQAYSRFPENRLKRAENGQVIGNVIVDDSGNQHTLDNHSNFKNRLENYLVGHNSNFIRKPESIKRAREESLGVLSKIYQKPSNRMSDVLARWRKLDEPQISQMNQWLETLT